MEFYPEIDSELANADIHEKNEILRDLNTQNAQNEIPVATEEDIAKIIGAILIDGGKGLDKNEKNEILLIAEGKRQGNLIVFDSSKIKKISSSNVHIQKLLDDDSNAIKEAALSTLYELGINSDIAKKVAPLLKNSIENVRNSAVHVLGAFDCKGYLQEILPLLKDDSADVRTTTVLTLGESGLTEIIPEIVPLLKDNDSLVRECALDSLAKLEAKEAMPEILHLLKDKDQRVRSWAALTLYELGADISALKGLKIDVTILYERLFQINCNCKNRDGLKCHERAKALLIALGVTEEELKRLQKKAADKKKSVE